MKEWMDQFRQSRFLVFRSHWNLPVSVLDGQVLLHPFHQAPEALGQGLLLGERLAGDQACPQLAEMLPETDRRQSPDSGPGPGGAPETGWPAPPAWVLTLRGAGVQAHAELEAFREN